jgi:hypothetical protein
MTASLSASLGVTPRETLDQSMELGHINPGVSLQEMGSIGDGPDGATDVVWYNFTLDGPALVHFELLRQDPASSFNGVLSLFNNDPTSYDYGDPYNQDGHRLLEQVDGKADRGVASFDRLLGQGSYYLAVSGDGNFDFHPFLAGSGLPGSTGGFDLQLSATDAGLGSATGPVFLTSDPAPGANLGASPLAIRVDLSGPLDPSTVILGQTVQLLYSPDGNFNLDVQQVPLAQYNFSPVAEVSTPSGGDPPQYQGLNELQLFPASPLAMGDYELVLSGQDVGGSAVLADPAGNALGSDAAHPQGQDVTIPFQVDGVEGRTGVATEDDTPASAQDLGDLTSAGLVQVAGAIGDDPGPDTSGNPANQVDLYHFTVMGTRNDSLVAEIFAGRIGSPLQPGLSLFRRDDADGNLDFVAGDMNSYNPVMATDGSVPPLYSDSVLYASLSAGDYYLAVAGGLNTPSPLEGQPLGSYGTYDPNQPPGSAQLGWSTGPYVLNLLVQPAPAPPHVVSTSPGAGETLTQPPTQLVAKFDKPVNLMQLAFQTYQNPSEDTNPPIYIEAADGTTYVPRFMSYDGATNEATFVMLDALPGGDYRLHLSGANGLDDLGGNPLAGNDPSGDYVVPFTVDAAPRGDGGNPLEWSDQEPNDTIDHPQDLGVLFPDELAAGVTLARDFSQDPATAPQDTADVYEFQVLLDRVYAFTLAGADLPAGVTLSLTDTSGQSLGIPPSGNLVAALAPGTYLLTVSGWDKAQAADLSYQVDLAMVTQNDNAPPLVSGPAPAIAILLAKDAPHGIGPGGGPSGGGSGGQTDGGGPGGETGSGSSGGGPSGGVGELSPVGPPASVSGTSSITTPAAAAFAIAIPAQFQGGPSAYGVTSTDMVALAASPMGGVVAPGEGAQVAAASLVQSSTAVPQSSVSTGVILLGTSLHLLEPGEEAAAIPSGTEKVEAPSGEVRDRAMLLDRIASFAPLARLAESSLALVAVIGERSLALTRGIVKKVEPPSLNPEPLIEAPPGAPSGEAPAGAPRGEAPPSERGRVLILAFAGLALGAYARYRRILRRDGRRNEGRSCARPAMTPHQHRQGARMGRVQG